MRYVASVFALDFVHSIVSFLPFSFSNTIRSIRVRIRFRVYHCILSSFLCFECDGTHPSPRCISRIPLYPVFLSLFRMGFVPSVSALYFAYSIVSCLPFSVSNAMYSIRLRIEFRVCYCILSSFPFFECDVELMVTECKKYIGWYSTMFIVVCCFKFLGLGVEVFYNMRFGWTILVILAGGAGGQAKGDQGMYPFGTLFTLEKIRQ